MRWLRLSWPNVAITVAVRFPEAGVLKVYGKLSGPILYTGEDWKDSIASAFSKKNTVEIKKRILDVWFIRLSPAYILDGTLMDVLEKEKAREALKRVGQAAIELCGATHA